MSAAFEIPVFASRCVAEFGTAAVQALRSGRAPRSELRARVCGEYALSFVEGEFDFTVAEMVSGVFSCDREHNAVCTPLAASDMLDMCVVEIEAQLAHLVVGAAQEPTANDARVPSRRATRARRQPRHRRPSSRSLGL